MWRFLLSLNLGDVDSLLGAGHLSPSPGLYMRYELILFPKDEIDPRTTAPFLYGA